ncbi:MAG TPA: tetratricopeptide repeat protein, partial [Saprospiraceae bacterium]|nr:tetratricopeptide repeat protein [Saprospiraceae bacterium]
KCTKDIKTQIKLKPQKVNLYVTLGNLYEIQNLQKKAEAEYKKAIEQLPKDQYITTRLASAFLKLQRYDEAIQTYEKGSQLLKDEKIFAYNMGELYRRKGDYPKMIENYINTVVYNPQQMRSIKTLIQRFMPKEFYEELQTQLYDKIQEQDDNEILVELLTWVFVQQKDYASALRQVKALDIRTDGSGANVYDLAEIAANDKDYKTAIKAYDYIVKTKGKAASFYVDAKREQLRCQRLQLISSNDYSKEDLLKVKANYEDFLNEFGRTKNTAAILLEYAELEAFYLNDIKKAIEILLPVIDYPGLNPDLLAKIKLRLADFYLMDRERWEATLLYGQVDKAHKEGPYGHKARYKNAMLSYYFGDFEWAQSQFDVLKASTSKLISNDAIDRSIFIMDNMGLDTSTVALEMYAKAELLNFQNRFDESLTLLDTLIHKFPDHSLDDDVLYLMAQIDVKKHQYEAAIDKLEKILEKFPEEIRADNALFEMAEIYEKNLNNTEKAKELYEKLFLEYDNSTLAIEARKRFRRLRGDDL